MDGNYNLVAAGAQDGLIHKYTENTSQMLLSQDMLVKERWHNEPFVSGNLFIEFYLMLR